MSLSPGGHQVGPGAQQAFEVVRPGGRERGVHHATGGRLFELVTRMTRKVADPLRHFLQREAWLHGHRQNVRAAGKDGVHLRKPLILMQQIMAGDDRRRSVHQVVEPEGERAPDDMIRRELRQDGPRGVATLDVDHLAGPGRARAVRFQLVPEPEAHDDQHHGPGDERNEPPATATALTAVVSVPANRRPGLGPLAGPAGPTRGIGPAGRTDHRLLIRRRPHRVPLRPLARRLAHAARSRFVPFTVCPPMTTCPSGSCPTKPGAGPWPPRCR